MSHPEEISLKHLQRITDDTGLIQHCIHSVPRREEGYCSDDNARALVFVALALLPMKNAAGMLMFPPTLNWPPIVVVPSRVTVLII